MGGGTGKGGVTTYVITFEPRHNVYHTKTIAWDVTPPFPVATPIPTYPLLFEDFITNTCRIHTKCVITT